MGGEARHGCDPPHGAAAIGADEEVTGVALSIAFGVTGRQLGIGRCVMGIEQPAAEGEVVAALRFGLRRSRLMPTFLTLISRQRANFFFDW